MTNNPLPLSISPDGWRLFALRRSDPKFTTFTEKVWERDAYTCQYCGFQAKQYQEVINLDGDYRNNKLNNLATSCCFCAQCHFLESVGKTDYGGGIVVYLPEFTQPELNGLCHVLFCAIANATSYRADAQNIYRSIKLRSRQVEERVGDGMSNPAILGQVLVDARLDDAEERRAGLLKDLRLLPSRTKFSKQIEAWAQAALEEMSVE